MKFTVEHKWHERPKKVNNFNNKIIMTIFPSLKKNMKFANKKYTSGNMNEMALVP